MPWVLTWFCFELNTIRLSQFANTNVFHSRLPVKRTVLAELRQHKEAFQIRCAEVCVAIRATRHLPTLSRETFRIKSWKTHRRKTQNWDFDQRLRQTWDFKTHDFAVDRAAAVMRLGGWSLRRPLRVICEHNTPLLDRSLYEVFIFRIHSLDLC